MESRKAAIIKFQISPQRVSSYSCAARPIFGFSASIRCTIRLRDRHAKQQFAPGHPVVTLR